MAVKGFYQKLPHPDSKTYVGKGKLEEIKEYVKDKDINMLIFDDELSGSQIKNIEKAIDVKTIDRSDLILDIFARRAKTAQAKAQVELAQYQYIFPGCVVCGSTWNVWVAVSVQGVRVKPRLKPTAVLCGIKSPCCASGWPK